MLLAAGVFEAWRAILCQLRANTWLRQFLNLRIQQRARIVPDRIVPDESAREAGTVLRSIESDLQAIISCDNYFVSSQRCFEKAQVLFDNIAWSIRKSAKVKSRAVRRDFD